MLELRVRNGELEGDSQWVYAWIGPARAVYVGATALHPAPRTWLHLRQQVRHSAVRLLGERRLLAPDHVCDPPLEAASTGETDAFVAALAEHLVR